jgi:hypothetical protein
MGKDSIDYHHGVAPVKKKEERDSVTTAGW